MSKLRKYASFVSFAGVIVIASALIFQGPATADQAKAYEAPYGRFASLEVTSAATFSGATIVNAGTITTADINGGTIDGATIGGSTAGAGSFSTLSAATSLAVGGGTAITDIRLGAVSIGASATTGTLTLSGITSSDKIIATIQSGNTSGVFVKTAVPTTGSVAITLSGTPGATTVVSVLAIQ